MDKEKIQISILTSLKDRIDKECERLYMNRSAFVAMLAESYFDNKEIVRGGKEIVQETKELVEALRKEIESLPK